MHNRSRYRFGPLICLLLSGTGMLSVTTLQAEDVLSLDDAVSDALTGNPGLAAIEARALALAELPRQVGALPDPSLSLNVANLPLHSFSFTQEAMTQLQVGISQALPYPGKLALRSQAAVQEAAAARAEVEEKRQHLIRDVKTIWWNLFYLDRALEIIILNQALLQEVVSVAETRYQVGRGPQQDILLAQLELAKLRENAIRIKNVRENEESRLNVLIDHPPAGPIALPAAVDENLPAIQSTQLLQLHAETSRQVLTAQQGRMHAARSRVELAKKDYSPDFRIGAIYGLRSGNNPDGSSRADFASIMFSMNLPIYASSKQDRAVDQRNAEWMQQKYKLDDQHNQVAAEVVQARTDYQRGGEQVRLFRQEILPQARQTVEAMLAGYQVGNIDFLSMIRSQTILFDHETQYWKALSTTNQALARLVAAVGAEEKIYE